ncbi:hypothetical protein JHW43_005163 [Diplocarpon mali]|nr:hypothetical protein JHW43_005163 [Diplocarpon mali]
MILHISYHSLDPITYTSQRLALVEKLGDPVFYEPRSPLPGFEESFLPASQQDMIPVLVARPDSPSEAAQAISIISQHFCISAVKSAGHVFSKGARNALGGISLDLGRIDDVDDPEDLKAAGIRRKQVEEGVCESGGAG